MCLFYYIPGDNDYVLSAETGTASPEIFNQKALQAEAAYKSLDKNGSSAIFIKYIVENGYEFRLYQNMIQEKQG